MKAISPNRIERRRASYQMPSTGILQPLFQPDKLGRRTISELSSSESVLPSPTSPFAAREEVHSSCEAQSVTDTSALHPLASDVDHVIADTHPGPVSIAHSPVSGEGSKFKVAPARWLTPRLETLEMIAIRRRQATLAEGNVQRQIKSFVRRMCAVAGEPIPEKKPVTAKHVQRFATNTVVSQLAEIRKGLLAWRREEEKAMELGVRGLPGLDDFWLPVPGLGVLGFAQLVSESGDLNRYANPAKLWKRFGLHVFQGKACATWKKHGLSAEGWSAAGYCPRRRSLMFVIVDSLLKKKAGNRYYDLYQRFKADEVAKAESQGLRVVPAADIPEGASVCYRSLKHVDLRARRRVAKRLLLDLWKAWRQETIKVK